jgi:hypothetical protein
MDMDGEETELSRVLTTNEKGAIAETAIIHHAAKLGIDVYRPVVEGSRCDMVFGVGRSVLRIQCKWAAWHGDVLRVSLRTSRHTPRGYVYTTYGVEELDAVVAYCDELDKCYLLPISVVAGRNMIYLRLRPARNGQKAGIQFAAKYELGAIAQLGERCDGIAEAAGSSPASSTDTRR